MPWPIPLASGPLGTLIVGVSLDRDAAERIKPSTNSDIAFVVGDRRSSPRRSMREHGGLATAVSDPASSRDGWAARSTSAACSRSAAPAMPRRAGRAGAAVANGTPAVPAARCAGRWRSPVLAAVCRDGGRIRGRPHGDTASARADGDDARDRGHRRPSRPLPGWRSMGRRGCAPAGATFAQLTGALDRFQREAAQRERLLIARPAVHGRSRTRSATR